MRSNLTYARLPTSTPFWSSGTDWFDQVGNIFEGDCASKLFASENGLFMKADDHMNVRMHNTA
jgi:hypothetical protein